MKEKCNLFAVVEINSNRAIALVDSIMSMHFKTSFPMYEVLPVRNTGTSTQRTDKGCINSLSIWVDNDEDSVYYIVTDWSDYISLDEAYELIK